PNPTPSAPEESDDAETPSPPSPRATLPSAPPACAQHPHDPPATARSLADPTRPTNSAASSSHNPIARSAESPHPRPLPATPPPTPRLGKRAQSGDPALASKGKPPVAPSSLTGQQGEGHSAWIHVPIKPELLRPLGSHRRR